MDSTEFTHHVFAKSGAIGCGENIVYLKIELAKDRSVDADVYETHHSTPAIGLDPNPNFSWWVSTDQNQGGLVADRNKIYAALEELEPLFERVLAGTDVSWNQNFNCYDFEYDDDARKANDEIWDFLQELDYSNENLRTCTAIEFVGEDNLAYFGLSTKSTDEELRATAEEYVAQESDTLLIGGGAEALFEVFQDRREFEQDGEAAKG